MTPRRPIILLVSLLAIVLHGATAFAIPQPSPKKQNFQPRKREVTVARLRETYGKPEYHIQFDEETSETLFDENHNKIGTIYYDEEIAFTIEDYFVIYYFSKGKFLARVIKGEPKASGPSDDSDPEYKQAK